MAGNREYKSDVFSMLMEDPQNALDLYNAVNHSDYKDPGQVEICTLDKGISLTLRNDASFVLDMHLSIYEHQSTICPNMPVRSLIYLSSILKPMLKDRNIYGCSLVRIPTPKFVCFYNGSEEQPEQYEMKLSDAFEKPVENPEIELVCTVYNINYGKNPELLSECRFLREYMIFVDYVRAYHKENGYEDLEISIEQAIDRCIEENVLRDFLIKRRWEVVKVMVLDYTFDRQLALEREDSRRAGWKDGRAAGMKAGMEAGMEAGRAAGMEAGRAAGMEAGRAAGMEAGRAAGRLEGKAEGRAEGELRKLVVQIYKKMQRQKSVAQIAEELEESEEDIHLIYETLLNDFQNFDADRICSELLEKNNGRGQD